MERLHTRTLRFSSIASWGLETARLSRGDLFVLVSILASAGIADSAYLAWQWYASVSAAACDISDYFSCSRVRESPYAALGGIPTAWIGVVGFAILVAFAILGLRGVQRVGPWTTERWILRFAILGGILGTVLTGIEVFAIQAVCILCAFGFALDLAVLAAAVLLMRLDE